MAYLGKDLIIGQYKIDYFSGDGTTVSFTLSQSPGSANAIEVVVDNVIQPPSSYSINGTTLIFTSAPASGTNNIWVRHLGTILDIGTPADGTVGNAKIIDGAITANKFNSGLYGGDYILLQDIKPSGTGGGDSVIGILTRDLNTVVEDTAGIVSLDNVNNQFTLPAGKYFIDIKCPCANVNRTRAFLYNVSDAVYTLNGISTYTNPTYWGATEAKVEGMFTITANKTFEIRQYFQAAQTGNGLGVETNDGNNEIYTAVSIWRVG